MDLAAAQEEIFQWKQAATKEADAGAAMLEEAVRCQEEVRSIFHEQLEKYKGGFDRCEGLFGAYESLILI